MKTIAYVLVFTLFAMSLTTHRVAAAHASGPSASGTYRFVLEDDAAKTVEFTATTDERGTTTGQMTFTDEGSVMGPDEDGGGDREGDPPSAFSMTADFDSLTIENNRAVMAGTIRDSSNRSYIGRWVRLVVEDNGDSQERPDRLSWCFCQPQPGGWTPVDAEDPRDEGAWMHWWATDAELKDDAGVASPNIIPGTSTGCPAFPLSTYSFEEVRSGEGQIVVSP